MLKTNLKQLQLHGDWYKSEKVFALLRMDIRYTLNIFHTLNIVLARTICLVLL